MYFDANLTVRKYNLTQISSWNPSPLASSLDASSFEFNSNKAAKALPAAVDAIGR